MTDTYEDIIHLPHHRSKNRTPMSSAMRAAQFAAFAALTGYSDMVDETARLTDSRPVVDEETAAMINEYLSLLSTKLAEHPRIKLTYFVPDEMKSGGAVLSMENNLRRIDKVERVLIFTDGTVISIDDICSLEGDFVPAPQENEHITDI